MQYTCLSSLQNQKRVSSRNVTTPRVAWWNGKLVSHEAISLTSTMDQKEVDASHYTPFLHHQIPTLNFTELFHKSAEAKEHTRHSSASLFISQSLDNYWVRIYNSTIPT